MAARTSLSAAPTFGQKVEALVKAGYIAEKQKEFLIAVIEAGNASIHRGHAPAATDVNSAMDITETLLQAVYALSTAKRLRSTTPARKKPKASS